MTNPLFLAVEWAHSLVLALGRKADTSISPRVFALFIGVILLLAAVQAVYRFFAPTQKAQVAPRPGQHGWTKCAPVLPAVCRVCHAHCSSIGGDINVSTEQTLCCEVCGTFVHEACLKTAGVRPRKAARNVAGGRRRARRRRRRRRWRRRRCQTLACFKQVAVQSTLFLFMHWHWVPRGFVASRTPLRPRWW